MGGLSMSFSDGLLTEAKQTLVQGMDLVNIPTALKLLAEVLREDVQAAVDDKEADPTYCENLLKAADDLEYTARRRFK